jgi:hypothetical protein
MIHRAEMNIAFSMMADSKSRAVTGPNRGAAHNTRIGPKTIQKQKG